MLIFFDILVRLALFVLNIAMLFLHFFMTHVKYIVVIKNTNALNKNTMVVHLEKWKKSSKLP